MPQIRARIVLLAAFVALLWVAAFDRAPFFCRMMERAVPRCCCAAAKAFRTPSSEKTIEAPDCCERIAPATRATVAARSDSAAQLAGPLVALSTLPSVAVALPAAQRSGAFPAMARAPPAIGPPLFIAHCSLLI
ncbi:MAG: hypothetical protein QM756_07645 [Polyangiaceae bacterium]